MMRDSWSSFNRLKITTSSMRFRNSGRKWARSASWTRFLISLSSFSSWIPVRPDIRCHDDDGIAEIDRSSLPVGQAAVIPESAERH